MLLFQFCLHTEAIVAYSTKTEEERQRGRDRAERQENIGEGTTGQTLKERRRRETERNRGKT
jgi:hypothetical protein